MRRLKTSKIAKLSLVALLAIAIIVGIPYISRYLNKVVKKATEINDYRYLTQTLTGFNGEKRILLLFMNNAESRFGGGFTGTVGYVTVKNGGITTDPIRSVYYFDKKFEEVNYRENDQFQEDKLGNIYNLRDGNQNMDWRYNGKRAEIIFEKEADKTVDIVIAVTPELLKYLIGRLGPISVSEYDKVIDQGNILDTVQTEVEYGQDKSEGKDPKTILSFVAEGVIQKLQKQSLAELVDIFTDSYGLAERKQLVVYSSDSKLAGILNKAKLDGAMARNTTDYIMVAENNYSIDKSNAFIDRSLKRQITVQPDGMVKVRMVLSRRQTRPVSYEYIDPHAPDVITNLIRANKSSIMVALPKNSIIDFSPGDTKLTKMRPESGYDLYSFNSELEPLVQADYSISYSLPYKYDLNSSSVDFTSFIQMQTGGWPYQLIESVQLPEGWSLAASNQKELIQSGSTTIYDKIIDKDKILSFIYAKKR